MANGLAETPPNTNRQGENDVSAMQKMVSASAGSLLTALLGMSDISV